MIENRRELIRFIVEAKQNTYASGKNVVEPRTPETHEYRFSDGDFLYSDTYYGGIQFLGQELVSVQGKTVLGMNYYGHTLSANLPGNFGEFLKEALLKVPPFAPYRGPRYLRSGVLEYSCSWEGDLEAFSGAEKISASGAAVYELHFHGGLIV
ncbi:MAG TPA: DUF5680 domain-containing protein [Spirochaetia bacterium]|nr:DUF5680 domain-containing protein [Spirochaetia bacterium]